MPAFRPLAATFFIAALGTVASCKCTPSTEVPPDCESGQQHSATLSIQGELASIRPVDGDKDIQVRGNRLSTDPCIDAGAQSAFSVRLQGDVTTTETIANLAPGSWALNVAALSGGSHDAIERNVALPNGGTLPITIAANGDGDMVMP